MSESKAAIVLLFASGLDYLIGDPWGWIHPVQMIGRLISIGTRATLTFTEKKMIRRWAGIGLGGGLILSGGAISWGICRWLEGISPLIGLILQTILLASCFAGRSLRKAAIDVMAPLNSGDLVLARSKLSLYVGRDTEDLSVEEILRAVLETVSENAIDGVMAPLFYAILGAFLGVGAVPLAFAYKVASTLDSMIGYRTQPYRDIGWFSARCEDYLTWLPCRFTVLTLALLSGKPNQVLSICCRDAPKDPSPNSGWSEGVYAAILGVRLGGKNYYQGIIQEKPWLGDAIFPITIEKVYQALTLTRQCFLLWLAIALFLLILPN